MIFNSSLQYIIIQSRPSFARYIEYFPYFTDSIQDDGKVALVRVKGGAAIRYGPSHVTAHFRRYDPVLLFFKRHFNLEKGLILGGILFLIGFTINLFIFIEWFSKNFGTLYRIRESIFAMTLLVIGLQTMFSSFFLSLLFLRRRKRYV